MPAIPLNEIITDDSDVKSYILFREMEEWCFDNLPGDHWRLDYSTQISVYGVDIPSKIVFKDESDITAFKLRFLLTK